MSDGLQNMLRTLGRISACVSVLCAVCSGCRTIGLTPRSGEIFQTTREGPGPMAMYPIFFGALCLPLGFVLLPVGFCLAIVDECVISPAVDLVCLPYDLSCPRHGYFVRFIDEEGNPVPGVKFTASSYWKYNDSRISKVTDDSGEIYISRLSRDHYIANLGASKEGYYDFKTGRGFSFRPSKATPGEDGRIVCQQMIRKRVKPVPMVHSQMLIPDEVRLKSVDLLYDCEVGSWLPPYGKGKEADLKVSNRISPEPVDGKRAPWNLDTRVEISAVRPEDGLLVRDVFPNCGMTSDLVAPVDGLYVQSPDNPALVWDRGENRRVEFPDSKYCIFRLRTIRAADGSILSAHYGKLLFHSGYSAHCYYGREPNEPSLEQEGVK